MNWKIFNRKDAQKKSQKLYSQKVKNFLGFTPKKENLFILALTPFNASLSSTENNERLEFLGDSVLNVIISDYIIKKYPIQDEGFLTEMRSKIVNRGSLNNIAYKMGISELLNIKDSKTSLNKDILGNTLESIIGALFLTKGYSQTYKWVLQKILTPFINFDALEEEEENPKNKVLSWGQKNKKNIEFIYTQKENKSSNRRNSFFFEVQLMIDSQEFVKADGVSKKEASIKACLEASKLLNL